MLRNQRKLQLLSAGWEVLENNPNPYLNFLRQKICKKLREVPWSPNEEGGKPPAIKRQVGR